MSVSPLTPPRFHVATPCLPTGGMRAEFLSSLFGAAACPPASPGAAECRGSPGSFGGNELERVRIGGNAYNSFECY